MGAASASTTTSPAFAGTHSWICESTLHVFTAYQDALLLFCDLFDSAARFQHIRKKHMHRHSDNDLQLSITVASM